MHLTATHLFFMFAAILLVIGGGIWASRGVNSSDDYNLDGRSSGAVLVAGSIAGTVIGGGATIGTAQMAAAAGLSAWWFTLGSGLTFIIMGLFYAAPLRRTSLETIPQFLSLNYGKSAGPVVAVVSSLGIFFSAVASSLPGIRIISAVLGISSASACFVLVALVSAYVFAGGMKSAGIGGILKVLVIWSSLFIAGFMAYSTLMGAPEVMDKLALRSPGYFSIFGAGATSVLGRFLSLLTGILCTQTYIQAIFSASDPKTAAVGAFTAAAVTIPVGLPCAVIGMFMHAAHPEVAPILVLPVYLTTYVPPAIGGLALGGLFLSLVGSIGGLSLGMATIIARDLLSKPLRLEKDSSVLRLTRVLVVAVAGGAGLFAFFNHDSQILFWNYLSMAFRGSGIVLPLSLAVFMADHFTDSRFSENNFANCSLENRNFAGKNSADSCFLNNIFFKKQVVISMVVATVAAIVAALMNSSVPPVFIGVGVSAIYLTGIYLGICRS